MTVLAVCNHHGQCRCFNNKIKLKHNIFCNDLCDYLSCIASTRRGTSELLKVVFEAVISIFWTVPQWTPPPDVAAMIELFRVMKIRQTIN